MKMNNLRAALSEDSMEVVTPASLDMDEEEEQQQQYQHATASAGNSQGPRTTTYGSHRNSSSGTAKKEERKADGQEHDDGEEDDYYDTEEYDCYEADADADPVLSSRCQRYENGVHNSDTAPRRGQKPNVNLHHHNDAGVFDMNQPWQIPAARGIGYGEEEEKEEPILQQPVNTPRGTVQVQGEGSHDAPLLLLEHHDSGDFAMALDKDDDFTVTTDASSTVPYTNQIVHRTMGAPAPLPPKPVATGNRNVARNAAPLFQDDSITVDSRRSVPQQQKDQQTSNASPTASPKNLKPAPVPECNVDNKIVGKKAANTSPSRKEAGAATAKVTETRKSPVPQDKDSHIAAGEFTQSPRTLIEERDVAYREQMLSMPDEDEDGARKFAAATTDRYTQNRSSVKMMSQSLPKGRGSNRGGAIHSNAHRGPAYADDLLRHQPLLHNTAQPQQQWLEMESPTEEHTEADEEEYYGADNRPPQIKTVMSYNSTATADTAKLNKGCYCFGTNIMDYMLVGGADPPGKNAFNASGGRHRRHQKDKNQMRRSSTTSRRLLTSKDAPLQIVEEVYTAEEEHEEAIVYAQQQAERYAHEQELRQRRRDPVGDYHEGYPGAGF